MKAPTTAVLQASLGCFQPAQDCLASATTKEKKVEGKWNEIATAGEGTASLQCIYLPRKFMLVAVTSPAIFLGTHWGPPSPCLRLAAGFCSVPCENWVLLLLQLDTDQV